MLFYFSHVSQQEGTDFQCRIETITNYKSTTHAVGVPTKRHTRIANEQKKMKVVTWMSTADVTPLERQG